MQPTDPSPSKDGASPLPRPGSLLRRIGPIVLTLAGIAVVLWLAAYLTSINLDRVGQWWHYRVRDSLVPTPATVIGHGARAEQSRTKHSTWTGWVTWMRYRYRVDGRDFERGATFDRFSATEEENALASIRARFPVGSALTVHYDPADPEFAVFDKDEELPGFFSVFFGLFFTGILLLAALLFVVGLGQPVMREVRGWLGWPEPVEPPTEESAEAPPKEEEEEEPYR